MSTISAGTTSGTTLVATGDTAGTLVFKTNDTGSGGTTALTLATDQTATFASSISTTAISGTVVATQANQETGTSTTTVVSPGRQQYHPSAAKAWAKCDVSGGVTAAYNLSSVTDVATGRCAMNLTTAFSSANYSAVVTPMKATSLTASTSLFAMVRPDNSTASIIAIDCLGTDNQFYDPTYFLMAAFGDQ